MKKFFYTLSAILAFVACSESDVDNGGGQETPKQPQITLDTATVNFSMEGGSKSVAFTSTESWTAEVNSIAESWCTIDEHSGSAGSNTITITVSPNEVLSERRAVITISAKNTQKPILIVQQSDIDNVLAKEREALIALYEATGGDSWARNDNWDSDKSVSEWYGIYTNDNGTIKSIELSDNNLNGVIPSEIGYFENIKQLQLGWNNLEGEVPDELWSLTSIEEISLDYMKNLTGEIPKEIGNLVNLRKLSTPECNFMGIIPAEIGNCVNISHLDLMGNQHSGYIPKELGNLENLMYLNLQSNRLEGELPSELGNLKKIEYISLNYNYLTGVIPQSIMELDYWDDCWPDILQQQGDGFSSESIKIYAPEFSIPIIGGGVITNEFISQHKYTILYNFYEWCPYSEAFTPILKSVVDKYKDSGLGIFSTTSDEESLVKACIDRNGIDWPCTVMQDLSVSPFKPFLSESPMVAVFDQDGLIVFNGILTSYTELTAFLADLFGDEESALYESTDYSKDGEVKQLQKATMGKGIDIVLMGDAFSDRLIADGSYDKAMNAGMEGFFASEPYKSFRDYFNVYSVAAVSKNEVYTDDSDTAFTGFFGEQTWVGGDDAKAMSYTLKAISDDRMDNALVVVMMNSPKYAGTCYMYYPETTSEDYGCGISVSYFPVGYSDLQINNLIRHEAGGHGFAKLADEYAYSWLGKIPNEEIEYYKEPMPWGWWKNADFTSDPTKVKWSHFLTDYRYGSEGLGVYEGAFTYWSGAYKPSLDSAMNSGNIGFNAPSREAIYYRIHKLAYGADWEYDYEEFVEWDEKNRNKEQTRGVPYRLDIPDNFQPTHPPVVINKSWRDAK